MSDCAMSKVGTVFICNLQAEAEKRGHFQSMEKSVKREIASKAPASFPKGVVIHST